MKAAARLRLALKRFDATDWAHIVASASGYGVDARCLGRAKAGRDIKPIDYLRLCRGLCVNPLTGAQERSASGFPLRISWLLFGMRVQSEHIASGLNVRRFGAKLKLSASTVTRARTGKPISTDSFLTICAYLGVSPDHFVIFHEVGQPIARAA